MSRLVSRIAGRTLPSTRCYPARADAQNSFLSWLGAIYQAGNLNSRYSTKASELRKVIPKLWVAKMNTIFSWLDRDGDGYITGNDFVIWETEMNKLLPDMSKEQKDHLAAHRKALWENIFAGQEKSSDSKMTEDMHLEGFFYLTTQEGSEYKIRKEWEDTFATLDINNDGVISKSEHQIFFSSWEDPIGAIVAFTAIDQNMDGVISRDEFAEAGTATEFVFNFTDETKPSKHMFGPLKY